MKLSELRYLVAFADQLSFSRAAEQCQVSQPSLSVALQRLEMESGVVLIERGKHHVGLTEVGERVVTQARKSLEEVGRIEAVAQSGKDPLTGTFRLGVINPPPLRRVALAWRRSSAHEPVIEALVAAVRAMGKPACVMIDAVAKT